MQEPSKAKIVAHVLEVLDKYCDDPADVMAKEARCMLEIADALKGLDYTSACSVIRAVREISTTHLAEAGSADDPRR